MLIYGIIVSLAVLELDISQSQVVPIYLGCYTDLTIKGVQIAGKNFTATNCNAFCFGKAYKHAAIRDGRECRCTDLKDDLPAPNDDGECDTKCFAEEKRCGGKDAFSIYTTGIREEDIEDAEELEIGCLQETDEYRLVREHKVDLIKTNSPKRCIAYCKVLGFPHAAVQYSQECYCGLSKRTLPLVEGCNIPCKGDPRQKCGGQWKSMLYSTGVTKSIPGITSRGCFEKLGIKADLSHTMDNMDSNKCISHCYMNSYAFAHILQGNKCLCGKTLPSSKYRGTLELCDIKCPSNEDESCGGETFAVTFSTGLSSSPSLGKLVGCYKDEIGNLLKGVMFNLGKENSIGKCISTCMEKGFAFAGVRNIFECYCSHSSPKRIPVRIVPDADCSEPCPANQLENCGSPLFTAIYRTGLNTFTEECSSSVSEYNTGKQGCSGQIIFQDEFNSLNREKWKHSVKISGEDNEFVVYTSKKKNTYIENGTLVIKPTFMPDRFVKSGYLELNGCTGKEKTDCAARAQHFNILPPIESGEICTKNSFNFTYGNITIRAKMAKGDWVISQIYLKPSAEIYGPGYKSGKFILALLRGNQFLLSNRRDISAKTVESGFQVSNKAQDEITTNTASIHSSNHLYNDFVVYHVTWGPDKAIFYVNGNIVSGLKTIYQYSGASLLDEMDVVEEKSQRNDKGHMAPFDQQFYICIGLYAGGIYNFPDNAVANDKVKPWRNKQVKGRLNFWLDKTNWEKTWSDETKLEVDFIKVTAL